MHTSGPDHCIQLGDDVRLQCHLVRLQLLALFLLESARERLDHVKMVQLPHDGQGTTLAGRLLVGASLSCVDVWREEDKVCTVMGK